MMLKHQRTRAAQRVERRAPALLVLPVHALPKPAQQQAAARRPFTAACPAPQSRRTVQVCASTAAHKGPCPRDQMEVQVAMVQDLALPDA